MRAGACIVYHTQNTATKWAPSQHRPVWTHLRPDFTLPPELLPFLIRGLVAHPKTWLPEPSKEATFHWQVRPADGPVTGKVYVDGSQQDSTVQFAGCCARRGWSLVAVDQGNVVASAYGLPPGWISSIPATETWALLQATQVSMPGNMFRTDCYAVKEGCQKSLQQLTAASNRLARAWAPIALYLEDATPGSVVWMPAHTQEHAVGTTRLSNGQLLSAEDRTFNGEADRLAKLAVEEDRVPIAVRKRLLAQVKRVSDVAEWIGRATLAANHFEAWESRDGALVKVAWRDSAAISVRRRQSRAKRAATNAHGCPKQPANGLFATPRLDNLRARVVAKAHALAPSASSSKAPGAAVSVCSQVATATASLSKAQRSKKKRRQKRRRVSPSLAAVREALGPALASDHSHAASSRPHARGLAANSSDGCMEADVAADAELLELERCGLRVNHQHRRREHLVAASTPACAPQQQEDQGCASAAAAGSASETVAAGPSDEMALLEELRELQSAGLRVVWPS